MSALMVRTVQVRREPLRWAKTYRRPAGDVLHVTIPRGLLVEIGVDPDEPLLVHRRPLRNRKALVLEFRPAERVPEADRI
jgi:hypothetical protein